MKIYQRLLLGFAIVIIINLLASTIIISNIENVQKYYQGKKTADSLVNDLKDSMLTEKDFRSAYDTRLVVDFQLEYRNITRDLNNLETSNIDPGPGTNFSDMQASVQRYHDLVLNNNNYLYSTENLWRTEESIVSGTGGIYQNSADIKSRVLEIGLKNNNSSSGVQNLYDLQQDERNYLSTHDASYLTDMGTIENNTLAWSDNDPELAQDIWRYQNNLEVLQGLYANQANTSSQIDGSISRLENSSNSIGSEVSARFDDMLTQATETIIALLALSVLFSIAISLFITRTISSPIENLAQTSEKIARGDLKAKVDTKGNDEVSRLARSIQNMIRSLRERIDFNDALVRNIADAMAFVNDESNFIYLNEPMLTLSGYRFAELIGNDYHRFIEGLPELSAVWSDVSCPCRLILKGGHKIDLTCRLSVLKNGDGDRIGMMIMLRREGP